MTVDQVIERYCILSSMVQNSDDTCPAADCFCHRSDGGKTFGKAENFRYDDVTIEFIEDAVLKAIAKKTKVPLKDVRRMHALLPRQA